MPGFPEGGAEHQADLLYDGRVGAVLRLLDDKQPIEQLEALADKDTEMHEVMPRYGNGVPGASQRLAR